METLVFILLIILILWNLKNSIDIYDIKNKEK